MNGRKGLFFRKMTAAMLQIAVFAVSSPAGVYADTFSKSDFDDLAVSLDCFLGLFAPDYQDVMRI